MSRVDLVPKTNQILAKLITSSPPFFPFFCFERKDDRDRMMDEIGDIF